MNAKNPPQDPPLNPMSNPDYFEYTPGRHSYPEMEAETFDAMRYAGIRPGEVRDRRVRARYRVWLEAHRDEP
jgi:hypothetical protein